MTRWSKGQVGENERDKMTVGNKIYVGDKMTDRDEMIVGHKVYL